MIFDPQASLQPQVTWGAPLRSWQEQPLVWAARQAQAGFCARLAAQAQAGAALPAFSQ